VRRSEIERLLPRIFQRTAVAGSPLYALLEVMEALHEPSEDVLRRLDSTLDPRRTAHDFVPFLARWVFLGRLLDGASPGGQPTDLYARWTTGPGRLRELVARAAELARLRGTTQGLLRFLETAIGIPGFEIDERVPGPHGQALPFHFLVRAPAAAAPHARLIRRIIEEEKPAYTTYDFTFQEG
jgi:phage tail-like protein